MQCVLWAVKNKLKKGTFGKKNKNRGERLAFFLSYISRGVIQKDKPQDVERGAGNEKTAMAENQDGTFFRSPHFILDESIQRRFIHRTLVLLEGYGRDD